MKERKKISEWDGKYWRRNSTVTFEGKNVIVVFVVKYPGNFQKWTRKKYGFYNKTRDNCRFKKSWSVAMMLIDSMLNEKRRKRIIAIAQCVGQRTKKIRQSRVKELTLIAASCN